MDESVDVPTINSGGVFVNGFVKNSPEDSAKFTSASASGAQIFHPPGDPRSGPYPQSTASGGEPNLRSPPRGIQLSVPSFTIYAIRAVHRTAAQ